jgi:hypothetical protein
MKYNKYRKIMIKCFKDFVNENYTDEELRDAERDTMEYDKTLDAPVDDCPNIEDDFESGEEEEEEEE